MYFCSLYDVMIVCQCHKWELQLLSGKNKKHHIVQESVGVFCAAVTQFIVTSSRPFFALFHVSSQVFHDELSSMRLWVSMHVSDHSGFHYRQFLLKELITELSQTPASTTTTTTSSPQHRSSTVPSSSSPHHHSHAQANGELSGAEAAGEEERQLSFTSVLQLFHQEMELCSDLIQSFPGHETLWSHR